MASLSAGSASTMREGRPPNLPSCGVRPALQAAPVFDKIVFSKIKEKLGGRVKLVVSGEQQFAALGSSVRRGAATA